MLTFGPFIPLMKGIKFFFCGLNVSMAFLFFWRDTDTGETYLIVECYL